MEFLHALLVQCSRLQGTPARSCPNLSGPCRPYRSWAVPALQSLSELLQVGVGLQCWSSDFDPAHPSSNPCSCLLQCLKFSTDQQADLKRVEVLNNTFFRLMARGPDAGVHSNPAPTPNKSWLLYSLDAACHAMVTCSTNSLCFAMGSILCVQHMCLAMPVLVRPCTSCCGIQKWVRSTRRGGSSRGSGGARAAAAAASGSQAGAEGQEARMTASRCRQQRCKGPLTRQGTCTSMTAEDPSTGSRM